MSGSENEKKAYDYQALALSKVDSANDVDFNLLVYNAQGNLEYRRKEYSCALKSFNKSLKIREEQGDNLWIAEARENVATTLIELERYNEALKFLMEALKVGEKNLQESASLADSYRSMAMCYYGMKEYKTAMTWIDQSLYIYSQLTDFEPQKLQWSKNWKKKIETALAPDKDESNQ